MSSRTGVRFGLICVFALLVAGVAASEVRSQGRAGRGSAAWTCEKCGATLGTGPIKPNLPSCPHCGAKFRDTPAGIGGSSSGSRSSPAAAVDDGSAERIGRQLALIFGGVFLGFVVLAAGLFTTAVVRSNRSPVTNRRPRALSLDDE